MTENNFSPFVASTILLVIVAGAIGWVLNIVKLIGTADVITGMFVARCIGIFVPPLGAVLGWF